MSKIKKIEFQILDPTGVEVSKQEFEYTAGIGNRIVININGNFHAFTYDGDRYLNNVNEIGICRLCGKKMKTMVQPEHVCMNPYCDNYIKTIKTETNE